MRGICKPVVETTRETLTAGPFEAGRDLWPSRNSPGRRKEAKEMKLPHFNYVKPKSIENACALLLRHGAKVSLLAGGTDLLVKMKQRRFVPGYVINHQDV